MSKELNRLYTEQDQEQALLRQLQTQIKNIENSDDFQTMLQLCSIEAVDHFCTQHPEYSEISTQITQLTESVNQRYKQIQTLYRKEKIRNEKARIKRSGLSEKEYRFHLASKMFGYTDFFEIAGFLLPDGNMLNFDPSGSGQRTEDHAIATSWFDDPEISKYGYKAIHAFMRLGAIRTGNAFIEICTCIEPTSAQYRTIYQMNRYYGFIYLDITDQDGCLLLSTQTAQAVPTIKKYFQ